MEINKRTKFDESGVDDMDLDIDEPFAENHEGPVYSKQHWHREVRNPSYKE